MQKKGNFFAFGNEHLQRNKTFLWFYRIYCRGISPPPYKRRAPNQSYIFKGPPHPQTVGSPACWLVANPYLPNFEMRNWQLLCCTVYKCGFGILDRVTGFVSLLHVSVIALYFVPANSDYEMIDNLNRRCAWFSLKWPQTSLWLIACHQQTGSGNFAE